ncbi:Putative receptor like protein 25 [Linum grandiflorum]
MYRAKKSKCFLPMFQRHCVYKTREVLMSYLHVRRPTCSVKLPLCSLPLLAKYLDSWKAMMEDEKGTQLIQFGHLGSSYGYYQDSIIVSSKGNELELQKILTIFKAIDLSSNNLDGPIPEVVGKFKAVQVLNFSHNAFTRNIPSAFGNLSNLESLDLSHNKLQGHIPVQLASLTFLGVMNLSDDGLVGSIPTGTQFQTFGNSSFGGNPNLCGYPLTKSCTCPNVSSDSNVTHVKSINWDSLQKEPGSLRFKMLTHFPAIFAIGISFAVFEPLMINLGPRKVEVVSAFVYPNDNQTGWANWTITLQFAGASEDNYVYVHPVDASVLRRSDNSVIANSVKATTAGDHSRRGINKFLMINLRTTPAGMEVLGRDLVGWWDFGVSVRAWVHLKPYLSPYKKTYLARISCYPTWIGGSESANRVEQDRCDVEWIPEGKVDESSMRLDLTRHT